MPRKTTEDSNAELAAYYGFDETSRTLDDGFDDAYHPIKPQQTAHHNDTETLTPIEYTAYAWLVFAGQAIVNFICTILLINYFSAISRATNYVNTFINRINDLFNLDKVIPAQDISRMRQEVHFEMMDITELHQSSPPRRVTEKFADFRESDLSAFTSQLEECRGVLGSLYQITYSSEGLIRSAESLTDLLKQQGAIATMQTSVTQLLERFTEMAKHIKSILKKKHNSEFIERYEITKPNNEIVVKQLESLLTLVTSKRAEAVILKRRITAGLKKKSATPQQSLPLEAKQEPAAMSWPQACDHGYPYERNGLTADEVDAIIQILNHTTIQTYINQHQYKPDKLRAAIYNHALAACIAAIAIMEAEVSKTYTAISKQPEFSPTLDTYPDGLTARDKLGLLHSLRNQLEIQREALRISDRLSAEEMQQSLLKHNTMHQTAAQICRAQDEEMEMKFGPGILDLIFGNTHMEREAQRNALERRRLEFQAEHPEAFCAPTLSDSHASNETPISREASVTVEPYRPEQIVHTVEHGTQYDPVILQNLRALNFKNYERFYYFLVAHGNMRFGTKPFWSELNLHCKKIIYDIERKSGQSTKDSRQLQHFRRLEVAFLLLSQSSHCGNLESPLPETILARSDLVANRLDSLMREERNSQLQSYFLGLKKGADSYRRKVEKACQQQSLVQTKV